MNAAAQQTDLKCDVHQGLVVGCPVRWCLRFGAAQTTTLFYLTCNSARAGRDVSSVSRFVVMPRRDTSTGPKRSLLLSCARAWKKLLSELLSGRCDRDGLVSGVAPVSLRGTQYSGGKLNNAAPAIPLRRPEVMLVCPCTTSLLVLAAFQHLLGARMGWLGRGG